MNTESRSIRIVTGLCAIGAGLTYLIGFWGFAVLLGPSEYGSLDVPVATHVQFLVDNIDIYLAWNQIIYILNAVLMVFLVIGLHRRLDVGHAYLVQIATSFGLIWSGLILAAGMVNHIGAIQIVRLAPVDSESAGALWYSIAVIGSGLGGGNEITGGLWVLLACIVGLRAAALPKTVSYLGICVGLAGTLSTLPKLDVATMIFGLGFIVWFFAVGGWLVLKRAR